MKLSRRMVIAFILVTLLLLAGVLFWRFMLDEIIKPAALVAWVVLRIFVLSIDQRIYWVVIILVALVFLFRLFPQTEPNLPTDGSLESNETINTIGYWRSRFSLNDFNRADEKTLRRELANLLAALYASKSRTDTSFGICDALQQGEIPLPEHIHGFLFPEETQESGPPIKRLLRSIRKVPRTWIRQWTGEAKAEQYRLIEEVLRFMEISLEIKNEQ